ncbi:hypothetical protein VTK73DRAFT_280 [Phialemonium thermophilum]|uniref:RRM domain-containing protein n=1 Tax=Phialemonium thermophilum TaxID=223376 RepID=A0ABR3VW19_9PEZI
MSSFRSGGQSGPNVRKTTRFHKSSLSVISSESSSSSDDEDNQDGGVRLTEDSPLQPRMLPRSATEDLSRYNDADTDSDSEDDGPSSVHVETAETVSGEVDQTARSIRALSTSTSSCKGDDHNTNGSGFHDVFGHGQGLWALASSDGSSNGPAKPAGATHWYNPVFRTSENGLPVSLSGPLPRADDGGSESSSAHSVISEPVSKFVPKTPAPSPASKAAKPVTPAAPEPVAYPAPGPGPVVPRMMGSGPLVPVSTGNGPVLPPMMMMPTVPAFPFSPQNLAPELGLAPLVGHPVPNTIKVLRSQHLNRITDGPIGRPTLDVALNAENFPFIESARQAEPVNYGVIKIKNIPFSTRRAEIVAFLGRNSRILNDNQEPVHIIMERVTSKTHDAYVEFVSLHDAMKAVERLTNPGVKGKTGRLGDRPVDVELSSQAALMKDLFPLATGVFWSGSEPQIQPPVPSEPWNHFKGFITEEEMTMLVKHVEIPQRSPFARDCPQRPFECMISTIKKLPWYMTDHITMHQRHSVYRATVDLIRLLQMAIRDGRHASLTPQLLKRLHTAAMLCPGFTVTMKDSIAYLVCLSDEDQRGFNQPRFADCWRHAYTLAPKPDMPIDVLEWYIAIIREESNRFVNALSLSTRTQIQQRARDTDGYFGYFWLEVGFPVGPAFDSLTLAEAAVLEFKALERIFARAFPRQF